MLKKLVIPFLLLLSSFAGANNVRIIEDANVNPIEIKDDIASVRIKIAWDNSWRDDFNHDAVYIFLKYRTKGSNAWKHAYFMDGGHALPVNYEYKIANSNATQNQGMGVFIQRSVNGHGIVEEILSLQLKWNIKGNLTQQNFLDDLVEYHATCIEMVYIPQGAFCLGDGISKNTFRKNFRPILPEWDLIKNDKTMTFYSEGGNSSTNPASNAANRVNETRNVTHNAWQAATTSGSWQVDFGDGNRKVVRYFGVSGVKGHEAYRPQTWSFEGQNPNNAWEELWRGNMSSWTITANDNSYPVQQAIKVNNTKAYQRYRIKIITPNSSYLPLANNIAMTDVDMATQTHDAYVVDRDANVVLDTFTNLSANDGQTWTGTLNVNYPTGFNGFYAMKYEMTQEQWVRFLNKLEYKQQKQRTVGDHLDELLAGDYVYGDKKIPNARNGIAVGARVDGNVVFVNNLNPNNDFASPDDGQTLACNYLNSADMLAYADWCGLRPLSEMEYEKMARAPYPALPEQKEWAGGSAATAIFPLANSIISPRKYDETINMNTAEMKKVNVNAGAVLDGPVRAGAFAAGESGSRILTGMGFWGVLELSGNLSEVYYKCSPEGRAFSDALVYHGDGYLIANSSANPGNSDMSASYWPQSVNAFILRGGSFKSVRDQLAVSDRSNSYTTSTRDSTVTFRLGHSYVRLLSAENNPYTELKLSNGQLSTKNGSAVDSVCAGSTYTVRGTTMKETGKTDVHHSFIWYQSENGGKTWDIIRGQEGHDLIYNNFLNDGTDPREIWFKRKTIGSTWSSETNYVIIRIINTNYELNREADTISVANHSLGYWVDTRAKAKFTWKWKSTTGTFILKDDKSNDDWDFYAPKRTDFGAATGNQVLICEMNMLGRCIKREEIQLYIKPRPTIGVEPANIAIGASDPNNECGVVMQDNRSTSTTKQLYATVRIGNQCWMAENLRYPISGMSIFTSADPSGEAYGCLYKVNRELVATVCPHGWRVPTAADWTELVNFLNADGANKAGVKLKQGAYWQVNAKTLKPHLGTNESGFGAVGTGHSNSYFGQHTYYGMAVNTNSYYSMSYNSSSFNYTSAYCGYCYGGYYENGDYRGGYGYVYRGWQYHGYYFPIRCIKN